jgi:hypothetical protein
MSETDTISIGNRLPTIACILAQDEYRVAVSWSGGVYAGTTIEIDLAPVILLYKIYKPLRDDPTLFKSVHVTAMGSAIAWGEDEAIDMAAATLERLADETMTAGDFRAFLDRHRLTLDAAAGQLGVSRRLVAHYAKGRSIPRYIALACAYLDRQAEMNKTSGANA